MFFIFLLIVIVLIIAINQYNKKDKGINVNTLNKDKRKAICPYCGKGLKKIPGAKTKCPHCSKHMYVRTDTKNVRRVVTKEGADRIEEDWMKVNGTYEYHMKEKERYERHRQTLKNKLGGKEPNHGDIMWGVFNEKLLECMKKNDLGGCRTIKYDMAEQVMSEGKLKHALSLYFNVIFLDINGVQYTGGDPETLEVIPLFDPKFGELQPYIMEKINKIIFLKKYSQKEVEEVYFHIISRVEKSLKTPISARSSWELIIKELKFN